MTFVVLAVIFFVLFVIGIPALGIATLYHYLPGIHFNPTLPINEFNPAAGRSFDRSDRVELLRMKLEATQVFGFMWEGLQQKGWAPMWEWSVIMSRKVVIIMVSHRTSCGFSKNNGLTGLYHRTCIRFSFVLSSFCSSFYNL